VGGNLKTNGLSDLFHGQVTILAAREDVWIISMMISGLS